MSDNDQDVKPGGLHSDLTVFLRKNLMDYPNSGTTIFKVRLPASFQWHSFRELYRLNDAQELVQNADDAGAEHLELCLDRRHFPVDGMKNAGLAGYQGPGAWSSFVQR
jgi:hypothetical protein